VSQRGEDPGVGTCRGERSGGADDPAPGRGLLADEIRARVFAALAGHDLVRGVLVEFVTGARRGARVRAHAWLDTGAAVTVERDAEDATAVGLAAAIVIAVERVTTVHECDRDTSRLGDGAACHP